MTALIEARELLYHVIIRMVNYFMNNNFIDESDSKYLNSNFCVSHIKIITIIINECYPLKIFATLNFELLEASLINKFTTSTLYQYLENRGEKPELVAVFI